MKRLWIVTVLIVLMFFIINCNKCISATTLDLEIIPGNSDITFSNPQNADDDDPWILADQYIHIEFESEYDMGYWGLRIVTDNMNLVPGDAPVGAEDVYGNLCYGGAYKVTVDDYGNIIGITDDPARKIILSWQVYNNNDPATIASVTAPSVIDDNGDGIYEDDNVSTLWYEGDWAYVGDKSDTLYQGDAVIWDEQVDLDGDGVLEEDEWVQVVNYNVIGYGIGAYWFFRWLVPHPEDPDIVHLGDMEDRAIFDWDGVDNNGDGYPDTIVDGLDIYLFLAGRFWNTGYYDVDNDGDYDDPVHFQLPAGNYKTTIYIELFHE